MISEVRKGDRRKIEEMKEPAKCDHNRIYQGSKGYWYCADCPAYDTDKGAFDNRSVRRPSGDPQFRNRGN